MKGWFVLDIISILPFDLASLKDPNEDPDAESSSSDLSVLKLVRIIRLLRLIKLVRLVRGARILKRWESKLAINYSTLTLWQSHLGQKCRSSQQPMRPPTALQRTAHLLRAAPPPPPPPPPGPERRGLAAWMPKRSLLYGLRYGACPKPPTSLGVDHSGNVWSGCCSQLTGSHASGPCRWQDLPHTV